MTRTGPMGVRPAAGSGESDWTAWLHCPLCKSDLLMVGEALSCGPCRRTFPVVLGIPDLRICRDPFVTFEEDHFKGRQVQEQAERLSFAGLLRFYWENVSLPPTPVPLRERFIRHVLTDEERIGGYLEQLGGGNSFLDVGCGAGTLLKATASRFRHAVGCDVAFRWLVLARKQLEEAGVSPRLVCCCADHLPFADGSFDTVSAISLLEHLPDAGRAVGECARVTRTGGRVFVLTTNRFSAAPEPHVRLWGVGFLPRSWMPAYVRWRRGLAYDKRNLSLFELRRMLRSAGFSSWRFSLPAISDVDLQHAGAAERLGGQVFRWLSRVPVLRSFLLLISPVLQALAQHGNAATTRGGRQ